MSISELKSKMEFRPTNRQMILNQWILIKSAFSDLRLNWKFSFLVVIVSPISFLVFLYIFMGNNNDYMVYALSGNMVMSMVTGTMLSLGQEFGVLKQVRGFDFYAILPIKKFNLVIAYVTKATIISLPSYLIIFYFGKYLLKANIVLNISLLFVFLIAGYSLSAIGVFIGLRSRNASQASIITQIIQPIMVFVAPVFIPENLLPTVLLYITYFFPTRYAACAIRSALQGGVDWFSIVILCAFCLGSFIWIEKHMDWRIG